MKQWMIAGVLLILWGFTGNASVKAQENVLPEQGNFICENYKNIYYTWMDGTLTISGEGDCLKEEDRYFFNHREEIERVIFDEGCKMKDISNMFVACGNLREVELSSEISDISSAFDNTGLTAVPELPEGMENISRAFTKCMGITEVDFEKFPASITNYTRAFQETAITSVALTVRDREKTGAFDYSYCFANCPYLSDVEFDGSNLNSKAFLWLEGLCDGCSSLKSFELKNVPGDNTQPGVYNASNMFRGCGSLTRVVNCGYFYYSAEGAFEDCTSLTTLQTKGFRGMYAGDCLRDTFRNCRNLKGSYYVAFSGTSSIYRLAKTTSSVKEYVQGAFKNCGGGLVLHIGCKDLVNYLKKIKTGAKFSYWKGGDPTGGYTSKKKVISTLKLIRYKKKTRKITGKTVKKGDVTIRVSGKTYKTTANSKGKFNLRVKKKLKSKQKIKVKVSKKGYQAKSKYFKVK